jgi:hypothetical protein
VAFFVVGPTGRGSVGGLVNTAEAIVDMINFKDKKKK